MKVLAIETSTLTGSVALLGGEGIIGEVTLSVSLQHSERLMPAIADLLRDAAVTPAEVDLYGVATGPGSFTGLRIGLAAAQGLALAHDKPIVGISTLEGLACHGVFYPGIVVPLLNAYRNEIYWGAYGFLFRNVSEVCGDVTPMGGYGGGESGFSIPLEPNDPALPVVRRIVEDQVSPVEGLISWVRQQTGRCLLLGDGLKVYGERLLAELGPEKIDLAPSHLQNPRGAHIAVLAVEKSRKGPLSEPFPKYLRRPG